MEFDNKINLANAKDLKIIKEENKNIFLSKLEDQENEEFDNNKIKKLFTKVDFVSYNVCLKKLNF